MSWSPAANLVPNSQIAQLPSSPEDLSSSNSPIRLLGNKITLETADKVMDSIADLVPLDSAYRPKYYAALYRMGPALFTQHADRARKGRFPQHLFRRLIDGPKR